MAHRTLASNGPLVQRGDARVQSECRALRMRGTRRGAPLGPVAEEEVRRVRQQRLQRFGLRYGQGLGFSGAG